MKIIFMGTAEFAVPALEAMASHICLVVSQPDRLSGRGMKLHPSPVKQKALELGLPIETPERCRTPEFIELLKSYGADCLLVAAYGQILSEATLSSARLGGFNLHGSILPKYRGAAPIQRAILDGETETGITLIKMDKGMDTGDMIAIEKTPIKPDETYGELQERLAVIASEMSKEWLPKIVGENITLIPQNHEEASYAPKVLKEEAELCFENPAQQEYNRFRAFTPRPGAYINIKNGLIKLSELGYCKLEDQLRPGTVVQTSPELVITFKQDALIFKTLQRAGKNKMSGRDFANGMHIKAGDNLVE